MVAKTENLAKISEVVDQSKTSYMHQRNQNKKLFGVYRGKHSLSMVAMVTRDTVLPWIESQKIAKK